MTLKWIYRIVVLSVFMTTLSQTCCGCSCPGNVASYRCVASGGVSTVWQGSAFNCTGNRISLLHGVTNDRGYCNGGAISGQMVSVNYRNYTSILNVTIDFGFHGKTVECWYNTGTTLTLIMSYTITVQSEPFPAPESLSVSHLNSTHLSFSWTPVLSTCPSLYYKIHTTDCGFCPTHTVDSKITCGGIILDGRVCTAQVQTSLCDVFRGNFSIHLSIQLKVPRAPIISRVVPQYYSDTISFLPGYLRKVSVKFYSEEYPHISNLTTPHVYPPPLSYTVMFTTSGRMCNMSTLTSLHCVQNHVCTHLFDLSTSFCPPMVDLVITVLATNQFGQGHPSDSVLVGHVNRLVTISFDSYSMSIVCMFVNSQENGTKTCSVQYDPSEVCHNSTIANEGHSRCNTINVKLTHLTNTTLKYCYSINANDGRSFLVTQGSFYAGCDALLLGYKPQRLSTACDPPYNTLEFNGGIVCYTTTTIGAHAFYYCLDCGFNSIQGSSVRTCIENGTWNGSTPVCECQTSNTGIRIDMLYILGTCFCSIVIFMVIVVAVCCISRGRVNRELKNVRAELNQLSVVYEELDTNVQQSADVIVHCDSLDKNIAYTMNRT